MSNSMNNKALLTYEDVADRLGVAEQTVRNKVSKGEWDLPKVKLGPRTVRFHRQDVDALIQERTEDWRGNPT